ncbi:MULTISPECIES: DM13 domain-containing protein [unclassified Oleiphilus]|jgi:hypothetical protein|uniref:DM13 domain-containing protein n=1 Tax=unclassified Oleiphilus TaxID=2631174 RepID=UPI0007C30A33|nr:MULTISPECIES: DM13 domain-containing protein [unclassified Oleiphilus]KZY41213.1 hypothetical protein A3732_18595 [Oleiphilus sp. HI0050]KZY75277.1 hypothetical protein A3741_12415 [Oleiphilus sp. HI0069]KZY77478.1 hypothetical protein A3740_10350 [Oleiphilus sp. HI0068]KZY88827.1 hypothetical protein A3743_10325 [Oleiphilus sp. HI0072]KZZ21595.1 hypothetical protein A3749_17475 [Oleiphilus sp. HI0078]KZZ25453.1 hypothetical protein A3752_24425 [Oleiphilus sp. HI0081]
MKLKTITLLLASHLSIGALGIGLGIYILPILTAPTAPSESMISEISSQARYTGKFKRDLEDSDTFHWGEGIVSLNTEYISLAGQLAPGPDYKLYLSKEFVETELDFQRLKSSMLQVGDVTTFENFVVKVPQGTNIADFSSVIVWCEAFGEFITAAKYQ